MAVGLGVTPVVVEDGLSWGGSTGALCTAREKMLSMGPRLHMVIPRDEGDVTWDLCPCEQGRASRGLPGAVQGSRAIRNSELVTCRAISVFK